MKIPEEILESYSEIPFPIRAQTLRGLVHQIMEMEEIEGSQEPMARVLAATAGCYTENNNQMPKNTAEEDPKAWVSWLIEEIARSAMKGVVPPNMILSSCLSVIVQVTREKFGEEAGAEIYKKLDGILKDAGWIAHPDSDCNCEACRTMREARQEGEESLGLGKDPSEDLKPSPDAVMVDTGCDQSLN